MSLENDCKPPEVIRAFSVLDLPSTADLLAVKSAYRELTKIWHPDRFAGDPSTQHRAQEKLKQINSAVETIEKFFARNPNSYSSRLAAPKISGTDQQNQAPQQRQHLGVNQSGKHVKSAPMLIGLMVVGVIVICVLVFSQQDGQIANQNPADRPELQIETPQATVHSPVQLPKNALVIQYPKLPKNVKYLITVNGEDYFTEKEPKPFGSGFKITDVLRKTELIVTGNIQIIKLPPPEN